MNIFEQGYPSLGGESPKQGYPSLGGESPEETFMKMYRQPQQEIPQPPNMSNGQKDMSGFANYGMTPPPLQDPMAQMKSLMSMNQPPKPQIQQQQGNLMSYLQQLGVL